jgi:tRNA pseudouridine55 synthase
VQPDGAPLGFVNAFKPPGPSSAAYGRWLRGRFCGAQAGHWGTLDPAASGVLVFAIGKATRLLPYLDAGRKSYVFELRPGARTDTADATGTVVERCALPGGWADGLEAAAAAMIGPLDQVPPMYSAVKIDGRPLYKSARAGKTLERASRPVEIFDMRVLAIGGDYARLRVDCSAGTYVRTLCEQLGDRLGLPAHLGVLLRTAAGPFDLSSARTPAEIARDPGACLIDPRLVLAAAQVSIGDSDALAFLHGNDVDATTIVSAPDGDVLVLHRDRPLGIGRIRDGRLAPVRVIAAAEGASALEAKV